MSQRAIDAVARIVAHDAGRDPDRLLLRYRAMCGSDFAFLRGTCHLFHERLPRGGIFASAPPVWCCGDLHLQNFGSYKADNRLVYFDINDFDESALAPASRDLVRLLASVQVAADDQNLPDAEAQALAQALLAAYAAALATGKAYWVERDNVQGPVRKLLDELRGRTRPQWLDARTQRIGPRGERRVLRTDGRKALPADAAQREQVAGFMAGFAKIQPDADFFQVLDVARRIAGTGSLGCERYVVLVRGKGSPDGNYLLDLKRAARSSLQPWLETVQPRWSTQAERIVAVQQRLQAVPTAFLHAVKMDGRDFVLRGLQPAEDRVALDARAQDAGQMRQLVQTLGRVVAWAQLRSAGRQGSASADELIDYAGRDKWKRRLLDAARAAAAQVHVDAATFRKACAGGAVPGAAGA